MDERVLELAEKEIAGLRRAECRAVAQIQTAKNRIDKALVTLSDAGIRIGRIEAYLNELRESTEE